MNRTDARKIAEIITNKQLKNMLDAAKFSIKDWTKVSIVNKGLTKGSSWNVLGRDFDITHNYHILGKINMIREFGEFLPDELKIKKSKKVYPPPVHQDPIF